MPKPQASSQLHGILVLDKPQGPTSSDCVQRIKRELGQPKIGHAGTLDPMASGVLVVLLGQGTKLAPYLTSGAKAYRGALELGTETDTYDIQGTVTGSGSWEDLLPAQVEQEVLGWKELTEQIVPPYAAAKHKGKTLYSLARAGKDVPVKTKPVAIDQVQVLHVDFPRVGFRLRCSAGTYVRSLAHSLGQRLGCGAVLTSLIREESEPFLLEHAHSLHSVLEAPDRFSERIIPLEESLPHWPRLYTSQAQAEQIANGGRIEVSHFPDWQPTQPGRRALLLTPEGKALALAETKQHQQGLYWAVLRGLWAKR
jgi:tRNA pseudouridine55 synthase